MLDDDAIAAGVELSRCLFIFFKVPTAGNYYMTVSDNSIERKVVLTMRENFIEIESNGYISAKPMAAQTLVGPLSVFDRLTVDY